MAVKGTPSTGSEINVMVGRVVDPEKGTVKLHENAKNLVAVTDRNAQNLDTNKDYLCVIVSQGRNNHIKTIEEYEPDESFAVIIQHFSPDRTNDVGKAIEELVASGIIDKLKITNDGGLYDKLTEYASENPAEVIGAVVLHGHNQIKAYEAKVHLSNNKVQVKVANIESTTILEKTVDMTGFFEGAKIEKPVAPTAVSQWINGGRFFVPKEIRPLLSMMTKVMDDEEILNVILYGESGTGKTEFFMAAAAELGMELCIVDCSMQPNANSWFYYNSLNDGRTEVTLTNLSEAIMRGNVLVLLDEVNRADNAAASNSLLPLLDNRRRVVLKGKIEVAVGKRVIFAATMNHGYQYVGTDTVDQALMNRFGIAGRMPILSPREEQQIMELNFPNLAPKVIAHILKVFSLFRERLKQEQITTIDATVRKAIAVLRILDKFHDKATGEFGIPMKDALAIGFINHILDNPEAVRFLIEIANTPMS